MDVYQELQNKLESMGVRDIKVSWSETFISNLRETVDPQAREDLITAALSDLLRLINEADAGNVTPLPLFGDSKGMIPT